MREMKEEDIGVPSLVTRRNPLTMKVLIPNDLTGVLICGLLSL